MSWVRAPFQYKAVDLSDWLWGMVVVAQGLSIATYRLFAGGGGDGCHSKNSVSTQWSP